MKLTILVTLTVGVAAAISLADKPTKPVVIPKVSMAHQTETIGTFCPSGASSAQSIDVPVVNENGEVVTIHCKDCSMGVYAKNDQDKYVCTYCEKEMH